MSNKVIDEFFMGESSSADYMVPESLLLLGELLFYLDFESVEFADVGEAETVVPVRGRNKGCRLSNTNRQRGVITM